MEPLYINETEMNKKVCTEFLGVSWRQGAKVFRYIALVLGIAMVIYGVVNVFLYGFSALGRLISMLIFGGITIFLAQEGHRMQARNYFMRQSSEWGADTFQKTVYFYDDHLTQESERGKMDYPYNKIEDFRVGRNIYILQVDGGSLVISRRGFTKGDSENFARGMQEIANQYKEKHPKKKRFGK